MAKRITKADKALIARLADKYGGPAVAKAALASPNRPAGRPADYFANAAQVWVHVELRRGAHGVSVDRACEFLARDLSKWTVGRSLGKSRLRQLYERGVQLRQADPAVREWSDEQLAELRRDGRPMIPLLLKQRPDGILETTISDRQGESGGDGGC